MSRLFYCPTTPGYSGEQPAGDPIATFEGNACGTLGQALYFFRQRAETWRETMAKVQPEMYRNMYEHNLIGTPLLLEYDVREAFDEHAGKTYFVIYYGDSPDRYILVD